MDLNNSQWQQVMDTLTCILFTHENTNSGWCLALFYTNWKNLIDDFLRGKFADVAEWFSYMRTALVGRLRPHPWRNVTSQTVWYLLRRVMGRVFPPASAHERIFNERCSGQTRRFSRAAKDEYSCSSQLQTVVGLSELRSRFITLDHKSIIQK